MADEACLSGRRLRVKAISSFRALLRPRESNGGGYSSGLRLPERERRFATACEQAGIKFIGPSWQAIEQMGSKTSARRVAIAAGAPVVPGTEQGIRDFDEASGTAAALATRCC